MQNTRDEGGGWMAVLKKVKNKAFCYRLSTEKQRNNLIKKKSLTQGGGRRSA